MTDITEPSAIRYCNEYLRPFAELLRNIKPALEDATNEYVANVQGVLNTYAAADVVADGREGEGIGRIEKRHINRMRLLMESLTVALNNAVAVGQDVDELLAVYTVRPLRIAGQ
jgi:hypothetical protein